MCCGGLCPGTGWAWWHHLMIPSEAWRHHQPGLVASPRGFQPGLCLSAFHPHHPHRCSPHPLLSRASLWHRRLQCPLCIARFWVLRAGARCPQPRSVLAGARRSSRRVSREGAALPVWQRFHGDRPFLPAAVPPPPERLGAFAGGQVGTGLGPGLAPSWAGSRLCLCVGLIPWEHPWGARRDPLDLRAFGAILPEEHPGGLGVMRDSTRTGDQPGAVCLWSHPWGLWGLGTSLARWVIMDIPRSIPGDGSIPAWFHTHAELRSLSRVPGDRAGSGIPEGLSSSLALCVCVGTSSLGSIPGELRDQPGSVCTHGPGIPGTSLVDGMGSGMG